MEKAASETKTAIVCPAHFLIKRQRQGGAGAAPGGPTSKMPAGERAPMDRNFRGLRRKFTISVISDFTCRWNRWV